MKQALYDKLARYYDLIYSRKDYEAEACRLREIIAKHTKRSQKRLLEMACGTGRHLEYLESHFNCTGIDLNPAMLRIARKRLKKTVLKQGDMRTVDLSFRFDVVLCLFNSIAYLRNYRELRQTINSFARHLNPGGMLIVESYLDAGETGRGKPRLFTYDSPNLKVARVDIPRRIGNKTLLDFQWLIAEDGRRVQFIPHDTHELTTFSQEEYFESMRLAGLKPRILREPGTGTVYLGSEPEIRR